MPLASPHISTPLLKDVYFSFGLISIQYLHDCKHSWQWNNAIYLYLFLYLFFKVFISSGVDNCPVSFFSNFYFCCILLTFFLGLDFNEHHKFILSLSIYSSTLVFWVCCVPYLLKKSLPLACSVLDWLIFGLPACILGSSLIFFLGIPLILSPWLNSLTS